MTKEQKIAEIRAKCIEANGDILKMEFGCEFKSKDDGDEFYFVGYEGASKTYVRKDRKWFQDLLWKNLPFLDSEIIGRKIGIADVLVAIKSEKVKALLSPNLKYIHEFWEVKEVLKYWNLLKDDLTLQDDSTVNFIHDILNTTK